MNDLGSWSWGISSPLGFGLLPVSLTPRPVVCSACFCPVDPFQKMPPEHENTKHWVNPHFTLPYQDRQFTYPGILLVKCITMSKREYSANIKGPRETDALKPSCCCWPHFCQHLPYPDTQLLSSMTCSCRSLLHQDIKSPMCCHFNN